MRENPGEQQRAECVSNLWGRLAYEQAACIANYRKALNTSPSDTVARWITETENRRTAAQQRLEASTDTTALSASQIRSIVEQMHGIVATLNPASTEDRRRVDHAAGITITYDHARKRAKLHTSPSPEAWSSVCVGGANTTLNPRYRSSWLTISAA